MSLCLRLIVLGILVTSLLGCDSVVAPNPAPAAAPSNIVFILVDDLGWMDLGVQGNPWYPTPNIDRLAAEGMRFTSAYAASPVCSPSRAAMMSGISGARTGITDFIPGHWRPYEELYVPTNRTQYLPGNYQTYAESLKEGGYTTAYFGKWHLGWGPEHSPAGQGFDTAHVQSGWGHFVPPIRFTPKYPKAQEGDYLTDLLTDMTVDFIAEQKDTNFLVVCSHFAVHVPLEAPDEMVDVAGKRAQPDDRVYNPTYVAMVEAVDAGVGRILATLDSLGLRENTLVVFGSDNGGLRQIFNKSDDVIATTNKPLRDEKGTLYE
ncbi:MAG: sulfatase-like hydrolase/transferase, partial [Bacteroidota bacterium]